MRQLMLLILRIAMSRTAALPTISHRVLNLIIPIVFRSNLMTANVITESPRQNENSDCCVVFFMPWTIKVEILVLFE